MVKENECYQRWLESKDLEDMKIYAEMSRVVKKAANKSKGEA